MTKRWRTHVERSTIARGMTPGAGGGLSRSVAPTPTNALTLQTRTPSSNQRAATVMVASDDADDATKEGADYVCDGTDDDVEIQLAIDSLATGGTIQLSSGAFNSSAPVDFTGASGMWLRGQGVYGTSFNAVGATAIRCGDAFGLQITDMEMIGAVLHDDVFDLWVQRCLLSGGGGYIGFDPGDPGDPFDVHVNDCNIEGGQTIDGTDYSMAFGNGAYLWVTDSYLSDGVYASPDDGTRIYGLVMGGNHCEGDVLLDQTQYLMCEENLAWGKWTITYAGDDNLLSRVCDNTTGSLLIQNSKYLLVDGNTIETALDGATQPVQIDVSRDMAFSNNFIQINGLTDLAGAIIDLTGDSDRVHIHGNTGRMASVGDTDQADYFLRIGASCDRTKAWGNDGYGTWDTAAVLDSGTNTDLTTANR